MALMTRRLAVSLDKIRALGHVAFVHTYRSSDGKRSSLATWLVLHLQEAYCKTWAAQLQKTCQLACRRLCCWSFSERSGCPLMACWPRTLLHSLPPYPRAMI